MAIRTARTAWTGTLLEGSGQVELSSSKLGTFDVSWPKRISDEAGGTTSPEELIAAAHSSCFSMELSSTIAKAGATPISLEVTADVSFVGGAISGIALSVTGEAEGLDADGFSAAAEKAKENCPVSKALAVPITLKEARLES